MEGWEVWLGEMDGWMEGFGDGVLSMSEREGEVYYCKRES